MLVNDNREQATAWETQKEKLRRKFTMLNEKDLDFDEKQKGEMLLKLKVKLGLSEERLQTIMAGRDNLI
jgi:hypothetical protein